MTGAVTTTSGLRAVLSSGAATGAGDCSREIDAPAGPVEQELGGLDSTVTIGPIETNAGAIALVLVALAVLVIIGGA